MTIRRVIGCSLLAALGSANAQSFTDKLMADLAAKQEVVRAELREATLKLREARANSCRFGSKPSCDQVKLSDAELVLLDLDDRYWRAERRTTSTAAQDEIRKVRSLIDDARSNLSDLASQLDSAEEAGVRAP